MKNIFLLSFLLAVTAITFAQETSNKVEYHSFSVSPLSIYFDDSTGGLVFNGDVSFSKGKHLFYLSFTAGSELTFFGSQGDSFQQLNVLYGRELKFNKTIFLDVNGGLGYFSFKTKKNDVFNRHNKVGLPVGLTLRFKTGKRFSLGLKFSSNINSVNVIHTTGITFHWRKL